jgi:hypothetical protein
MPLSVSIGYVSMKQHAFVRAEDNGTDKNTFSTAEQIS